MSISNLSLQSDRGRPDHEGCGGDTKEDDSRKKGKSRDMWKRTRDKELLGWEKEH